MSGVFDVSNAVAKLKIYPNIVRKGGDITVETSSNNTETRLQVVDLSGRVLKTVAKAPNTEGVKISTSDLPTGRYFIRSSNQTGDFTVL